MCNKEIKRMYHQVCVGVRSTSLTLTNGPESCCASMRGLRMGSKIRAAASISVSEKRRGGGDKVR